MTKVAFLILLIVATATCENRQMYAVAIVNGTDTMAREVIVEYPGYVSTPTLVDAKNERTEIAVTAPIPATMRVSWNDGHERQVRTIRVQNRPAATPQKAV